MHQDLDNRLTVAYNGFGCMHWTSIDNISLENNEEELSKIACEIRDKIMIQIAHKTNSILRDK